jgi:hypothetical protein
MNVLEVPEDVKSQGTRSRSSSISFTFATQTLNPDDRFTNPRPVPQPPKPRLPRLITPATLEAPGFKFDSLPVQRNRPWTAVSPSTDHRSIVFPKIRRDIKSASGSPTTALRSAFDHVRTQSLPSALTPSQGGRGRSRILHSTHTSDDRTNDPSIRELRGRTWSPFSEMQSPEASPIEASQSPMELAPDGMSLLPRRRTASPHRFVRDVVELSSPTDPVDLFPDPSSLRIRGRSVSSTERRHSGGVNRRSRNSDDWSSRRSSSLGRRREPSPLRHVLSHSYAQSNLDARIPEGIMEVDNEDLMSPRKALDDIPTPNDRPRSSYSPSQETMTGLTPSPEPKFAVSPINLEKELPPLPPYLIPKPLFSRPAKETNPIESAIKAMNDAFEPGDHFPMWSTVSNASQDGNFDHPESPATDNAENSPTFSSIKDSESGACTPQRFSGPDFEFESQSPLVYPQDAFAITVDSECAPMAAEEAPNDMPIDGKTPTAASFGLSDFGVGFSLNESFGSVSLRSKTETQDDAQPARQLTQMEQLLNDFDYLGAALT